MLNNYILSNSSKSLYLLNSFFLPPFSLNFILSNDKIIIMVPNRIWHLYLEGNYEENKRLECSFLSVMYVSNTIPQRLKDHHSKRDDKFVRTLKQSFLFTSGLGLCIYELSLTPVINTRTACTRFFLPKQSMD